jgi:hypothetical protein
MAIQSGGAEEARNQGQRAADVISQGRIAQGQAIGQGLQNLGEGYVRGADMATKRAAAEEQMAQSRQQRELTGLQTEGEKQRLAALPGQLQQQQQLTEAQIGQAKSQEQMQQIQARAAVELERWEASAATEAHLPDAMAGETVRQYTERMKQLGATEQVKTAQAQRNQIMQQIAQAEKMNPLELKQAEANIEAAKDAISMNRVNKQIATLNYQQQLRGMNVNTLAGELSPFAQDPERFQAKQRELIESGVPPGEVYEAVNNVITQTKSRQMQDTLLRQSDPAYQRWLAVYDKNQKYNQALGQLQQLKSSIENPNIFPNSKVAEDALANTTTILNDLGMTESAKGLNSFVTFSGLLPISRKTLLDNTIKELEKRFKSDISNSMPGGLGSSLDTPAVRNTWEKFQAVQFLPGVQSTQPTPNVFQGMGTLDFSKMGAPK